jgi:hypothetical protein
MRLVARRGNASRWHGLRDDGTRALCGAAVRADLGWVVYGDGEPTCLRCLRAMRTQP